MKLWVEHWNSLWTSPRTTTTKRSRTIHSSIANFCSTPSCKSKSECLVGFQLGWHFSFSVIFICTLLAKWKKIKFLTVYLIETLAKNILSTPSHSFLLSIFIVLSLIALCSFTFKLTRNENEFTNFDFAGVVAFN